MSALPNAPCHRLEMSVVTGSPVIGGDVLKTTTNTAYEVMKQRGQGGRMEDDYELINSPPGAPPPDIDEKYDIASPLAPQQPLPLPSVAPPTAANMGVVEEAEGMYEIIPGDK